MTTTKHIYITSSSFVKEVEYDMEAIRDDGKTIELILWFESNGEERCYSYICPIDTVKQFVKDGESNSWGKAYNKHIKRHGFEGMRVG